MSKYMYKILPSFVLGFHGCDEITAEKILNSNKQHLSKSDNKYDWLGEGVYFWENDPERALHFANVLKNNPDKSIQPIKTPAVIGAIIDLGRCLNLMEFDNLRILKESYNRLCSIVKKRELTMPKNKGKSTDGDLLYRYLDCAVIKLLHKYYEKKNFPAFDTVRGVFWEGKALYPDAGFKEKNHIQICVRNHDCIKGYFRPRNKNVF